MNTLMKKQPYNKEPYSKLPYEANIPELGKDWPPPEEDPEDNLLSERHRPEMAPEERKEHIGSKRRMQSDLRYTSAMKKKDKLGEKEAQKKVTSIAERADNILMKIKSVFPFDLFPNTVTIDSNKVIVVDKAFFASETVTSILLEEVTDIVVESNFFLAQIVITYSHHPLRPLHYKIPNLRKHEALRAAEIIQGLLVLRISEGIDLSKLEPEEIIRQLGEIGKSHQNLGTI